MLIIWLHKYPSRADVLFGNNKMKQQFSYINEKAVISLGFKFCRGELLWTCGFSETGASIHSLIKAAQSPMLRNTVKSTSCLHKTINHTNTKLSNIFYCTHSGESGTLKILIHLFMCTVYITIQKNLYCFSFYVAFINTKHKLLSLLM